MYCHDFEKGVISVLEKRANLSLDSGWLAMLNAAANIKGLSDISNKTLMDVASDQQVAAPQKKERKPKKLKMTIDKELLSKLTPEQRKKLFFAVRGVNAQ